MTSLKPNRRSGSEDKLELQLKSSGLKYTYEQHKIDYVVPARHATYTPDFKVGHIYIEVKGTFMRNGNHGSAKERQKLILVKEQHPKLDIRLVFDNAKQKIYKGSKTALWQWADKHGFPWADNGTIPDHWIQEMYKQQVILGETNDG
jgi:hypothetical protein